MTVKTNCRGFALVTVLLMTGVLAMMLIALYVSVRGSLLSASLQSRRVSAAYVAEAGLAEALHAIEASNFSLTTGSLTGELSSCLLYTSPSPRDRG